MVRYEADAQSYTVNQMFIRDMISHAAENVQWLIDNGVQYEAIEDLDPAYLEMYKQGRYRAEFSFDYVYKGGAAGIGYFPYMKKKLAEYGVNVRLNTRVPATSSLTRAATWPGRLRHRHLRRHHQDQREGGHRRHGRLRRRRGPHWASLGIDLDDIRIIGTPGHYGDGVNMMIEAGGIEHGAPAFGCTNIIGSAGPWGPIWDKLCWGGPCLWVDINGERFSRRGRAPRTRTTSSCRTCPCVWPAAPAGASWTRTCYEYMLDGDEECAAAVGGNDREGRRRL